MKAMKGMPSRVNDEPEKLSNIDMKAWFVALLLAGAGLLSVGPAADHVLPVAASADAVPDLFLSDPWAPDDLDDAIVPPTVVIEAAPVYTETAPPAPGVAATRSGRLAPPARAPPTLPTS